METFEMVYDGISGLNPGDIWATKRRGTFVVVSSRAADWRGDDRDVYSHIDEWLTCRPATPDECAAWDRLVSAAGARRALRSQLNADRYWQFDGQMLCPPEAATRRLDSYDDRWEPPVPIALSETQIAIEREYADAHTACVGRPVS